MLANAQQFISMQQKVAFRINALACVFGRGGLGVPAELTSRDIAVLALHDVDDATCKTDVLGAPVQIVGEADREIEY